ncbi:MAG: hypothetical protein IPK26_23200 [Planctomycetes bacterium]|nr:hypothetical protein [Planctomycetota bacterium]
MLLFLVGHFLRVCGHAFAACSKLTSAAVALIMRSTPGETDAGVSSPTTFTNDLGQRSTKRPIAPHEDGLHAVAASQ